MNENEHFDGITFSPEEFLLRFANRPAQQTPPKHSTVWAYTLQSGVSGLIFADTEAEAEARLCEEYDNDAVNCQLIRVDDDQDIIEII